MPELDGRHVVRMPERLVDQRGRSRIRIAMQENGELNVLALILMDSIYTLFRGC
jgi:hypothetical protein